MEELQKLKIMVENQNERIFNLEKEIKDVYRYVNKSFEKYIEDKRNHVDKLLSYSGPSLFKY